MEIRREWESGSAGAMAPTIRLLGVAAAHEEPALCVWTPEPQVAFGRRDERTPTFETAKTVAREAGYATSVRQVGGRAVAYTGSTVAIALAEPTETVRGGLQTRYEPMLASLETACETLGVAVERGEPANSFCPGSQSLSAGGKLAGLAQRVTSNGAVVAGVLHVAERDALAGIHQGVYDALGLEFDPKSVSSLAANGGPSDSEPVIDAVEDAIEDRWKHRHA